MNHAIRFLSIFLGAVGIAHAVPTAINYQGRLTDGDGNPASGSKLFSLSLYDAATAGNELYTETIGSIAVDDNGIYNFQFGANGTSTVAEAETLAVTDGSSTIFNATPSSTPIAGTLSVTDGTYSWNEVDGNPGELASATTQLGNGFVIGYAVTNGGEGYTTAPVVTINGDGIGATATATVSGGAITSIAVDSTGSGYTTATVSIAEPPAPFVVDYSAGELTFTYEAAPSAGVEITASYDANDTSIVGALSAADAHWLELSIDGDIQSPRERILSVPFAQVAGVANGLNGDQLNLFNQLNEEISYLTLGVSSPYSATSEIYLTLQKTSVSVSLYGSPSYNLPEPRFVRRASFQSQFQSFGSMSSTFNYRYTDGTSAISPGGANPFPTKQVRGFNYQWFSNSTSGVIDFYEIEPSSLTVQLPESLPQKSRIWFFVGGQNLFVDGDQITARLEGVGLNQDIVVNGPTSISGDITAYDNLVITLNPAYGPTPLPEILNYTIRISE